MESAQQQFEAQQTLENFQKEAAEEREKLEKQLVSAEKGYRGRQKGGMTKKFGTCERRRKMKYKDCKR